jgi:ATP-dependent RNA helicase DHX8/PRP22
MEALEKLELLSLVSKLTTEISHYTGVSDKTLAEFIIDLHSQCEMKHGSDDRFLSAFQVCLEQVGAEFPESFVENIDRLIRHMHPNFKKTQVLDGPSSPTNKRPSYNDELPHRSLEEKEKVFRGLSIPDTDPVPEPDSMRDARRSPSPRQNGRRIPDSRRGRSPSPRKTPPWRRRDISPWGDRGRDREQQRRYRERSNDRPRPLLDEPKLNEIYDARIGNMTNFGAFATLLDFRTKIDGMTF